MYFISKYGKWYYIISGMSHIKRYMVSMAMIFVWLTTWYYMVYQRLDDLIMTAHQSLYVASQQLAQGEGYLREYQQRIHDYKKKYTALCNQYESQTSYVLFDLCADITARGMQLISCTPEKIRCTRWGTEQKGQFIFTGTFDQIWSFFDQITKGSALIRCSSCSLSAEQEDQIQCRCCLHVMMPCDTSDMKEV